MNVIGIIPARYQAKRFPGKPLAPILNKPMILWVLEGVSDSRLLDDVIVATDNEIILKTVREAGYRAEMTRIDHPSGTDRIWEIAEKLDCTHVLNIQGDEPLIKGEVVDQLLSVINSKPDLKMATMVKQLDPGDADDPNRVKVVISEQNRAIYFSRSRIPYVLGDSDKNPYLLHIGMYLYEKNYLRQFIEHGPSMLEKIERLEQLRALEMDIPIETVKTDFRLFGVDAPHDIEQVEKILNEQSMK
jgi:3-deoxy-manno-octulosonate cytidylyltransferase (CMP-KDO synthetase)